MSQTSILSTKTLSDVQRQAFLDANFDLLEQDFIEIKNNLFELNQINTNLIFSSAVVSLMEQNGWEALKTKMVFCVGIKTKNLEANGFTVSVYMDYASELAEIITLIYNKESYTFFWKFAETLPEALKRRDCV
jgi:uroporphyrinogen-III synthase